MSAKRPQHAMTKADWVQVELLRRQSVGQRVARMRSLSSEVIEMSRRAIRNLHPDWSERDVLLEWAAVHYGRDLADKVRCYMDRLQPRPPMSSRHWSRSSIHS